MLSDRVRMPRGFLLVAAVAAILAASPVWSGTVAAAAPADRPATVDEPVPVDLTPSLAAAPRDYPAPYFDGCHVQQAGVISRKATCIYGDATSPTEIILFGDSHALSWFPAVEEVAMREGWRLRVLTMSACSPADIPNWNSNYHRVSTACSAWRKHAMSEIAADSPAIVLVAGTRGFATVGASGTILKGAARTRAWQAGMDRTLERLVPLAARVIYIGDSPLATQDPPRCLAANPMSTLACATPVSSAIDATWLADERQAADVAYTGFVDPTPWICPSSPCPVVIDGVLVFRDMGHLTATFASTLADPLDVAILADLEQSLGTTTFD